MSIAGSSKAGSTAVISSVETLDDDYGAGGTGLSKPPARGWFARLKGACGAGTVARAAKASALALAVTAGLLPAADAAAGPNDVLVLGDSYLPDFVNGLQSQGVFGIVNGFSINGGTPPLSTLQNYGAVFLYNEGSAANPTGVGDVVAQYYEGGGALVVAGHSETNIFGQWNANYNMVQAEINGAGGSLVPVFPAHPVFSGVTPGFTPAGNIVGPFSTLRAGTQVIGTGATDGSFLVMENQYGSHKPIIQFGFAGQPGHHLSSFDPYKMYANALQYVMTSAVYPPAPFYLQTNSAASPSFNGDWYTASTAGNGADIALIHVPLSWDVTKKVTIDLLSPDWNANANDANAKVDGLPHDENNAADTLFELYAPGATYDVRKIGAGEIAGSANTAGFVNGTLLFTKTYHPGDVTHGDFDRFFEISGADLVPGGVYVLRSRTLGAVASQNGWRVAAGYDPDGVNTGFPLTANPDAMPNSGDEVFVSTPGQTLEFYKGHVQAPAPQTNAGVTFYRFVDPGQAAVRFHNFDMDGNLRLRYYAPSDVFDINALTGGRVGTLSANDRWNPTTNTSTLNRVGDVISNPEGGYWKIRAFVNSNNQFNLETTTTQPMFAVPPPSPVLAISKTSDNSLSAPAIAGDTINYTITITNTSDATAGGGGAYDAVLTDVIPADLSLTVPSSTPDYNVTYNSTSRELKIEFINTIEPADTFTINYSVTLDAGIVGPTRNNTVIAAFTNSIGDIFSANASSVVGVNAPPTVGSTPLHYDGTNTNPRPTEDVSFTVTGGPNQGLNEGVNDPEGNSLTYILVTPPTKGTLDVDGSGVFANTDGSFTYTPNLNANGPDSFTYIVQDQYGQQSAPQTVYLDILAVNDPPTATDIVTTTQEDTPLTINVIPAYATDIDSASVTVTSVTPGTGSPGIGITPDGLSLVYTPAPNFTGPVTFTYTVTDSDGASTTANGTIYVSPVNDPPIPVDDYVITNEDTTATVNVRANDIDIDNNVLTAQVTIVTPPTHGTAVVQVNGNIRYVPFPNYNGPDSLTYRLNDGTDNSTGTATVYFTILPVNDAPVANDDQYVTAKNQTLIVPTVIGLIANDNDVDNTSNTLTVQTISIPAYGLVTLNPDGSFEYVPYPNFLGQDQFDYVLKDPSNAFTTATVYINVGPHNQVPITNADVFMTSEGLALSGNVLANDIDPDGDVTTATVIANPLNGSVTMQPDGSFTYTPNAGFNGTDTFTYQAYDTLSMSPVTTVTINVLPVNDAPVAINHSYQVLQGNTLTVGAPGVLTGASDPDAGDTLTANAGTTAPQHGTVIVNADGSFVYTPVANYYGPDSFSFEVRDGNGGVATGIVTITVLRVNTPPVAVDDNYTVNEDETLTVPNSNGVLNNDTDADNDVTTAVLVSGPQHGTLSAGLNKKGGFVYTPAPNFAGTDYFTYRTSDGLSLSNIAKVNITVIGVNDAPVAQNDVYFTSEDQVLTIGAPGVLTNDSDVDGDTLTAVLVNSTNYGSLVLNSNGSFTYTPVLNFNGLDTFRYKVTDGTSESATAVVRIHVAPVADVPVAMNDTYVTNEDTTLTVTVPGVIGNDTSVDGPMTSSVQLLTQPVHGTLSMNPNGSFDYVPYPNYNGPDSFTYQLISAVGNSNIATVNIQVTSIEDIPVALPNSYATAQNQTLTVSAPGVLGDDTDGDGDPLSATLGTINVSHGALTLNSNGSFTYVPSGTFAGTDMFTYFASDNKGNLSAETTVTLVVGGVNHAPVAVDDVYSTGVQNQQLIIGQPGFLANDTDQDNDVLTATLVQLPQHGTLNFGSDGSFAYTPFANYSGPDFFTYKANDGQLDSNIATVYINTQAVPGAPVARNDNYTVLEDTTLTITAPGVLGNDFDPENGNLTASLISGPSHGSLVFNGNGSFTYTPQANWNSEMTGSTIYDSFRYLATDDQGLTSIARVRIYVQSVLDQPVANDDNYTLLEDSTDFGMNSPVTVLANDQFETFFLSGPGGSIVIVQDEPDHGTLDLDPFTGLFTYVPDADFFGTDTFTYVIGSGDLSQPNPQGNILISNVATVTLSVIGVNDAPVAQNDSYQTPEDQAFTAQAPGVLSNDSDADGDTLSAVLNSNPANGVLALNADGSFTYTPNQDYFGADSFTYYAVDTSTSQSQLATVFLTITPVNDAPVTVDDNYVMDEDTTLTVLARGVLQNDTDVDDTVLTATKVSDPLYGRLVHFGKNGSFTYVPDANFFGTDSFTYRSNDGKLPGNVATVYITVKPVQDAPVGNEDTYGTIEGTTLTISAPGVLANDVDVDGDGLVANLNKAPNHGIVNLNADGSFTYVPFDGYYGEDQFLYYAFDGFAQSNLTTVTITVGFVNDPPVARDDEYFVFEDQTTTITAPGILANDFDPEDDVLTATLVQGTQHGTLTLESSGTVVYTPNPNFVGDDYFLYQASDGIAKSNVARVTFHVSPVNDEPLVNPDYYSTDEEKPLNVVAPGVLANDFDVDDEPLISMIKDNPTSGIVTLNGDGSFYYVPQPGFFGEDFFTYTVTDGHMETSATTVTIFVRPVNDAPVALADIYDAMEDTPLNVGVPGVLGNDMDDDGDALTAEIVSGAVHGVVSLYSNGSFDYIPAANFSGEDTFVYRAFDGLLHSAPVTVTIRVREVPEAPVADTDEYSTPENHPITVPAPGILANDFSPDGKPLTAILQANPSEGDLTFNADGSFTYAPHAGFFGTDFFLYVADDGSSQSAVTTVTLTVGPVNDAPVANDDVFNVSEGTATTIGAPGVLANDTDIDDAVLTATLVNGPLFGSLTFNEDGSFTYEPFGFYNGPDSFTYQASDGKSKSNVATVRLTVLPVQNGPVANEDFYSTNEEVPLVVGAPGVLINDYDNDGETLTAVLVDNASSGSVTLNGDGSFTYTPDAGFFGVDTFTYQATDSTSASAVTTVTVTVRGVNDAPVARDDIFSVAEDGVSTVTAPGVLQNDTDQDGDPLIAELLTLPLHGDLAFNTDGSFVYTPYPNFAGTDSFTYRAVDPGNLFSDPATVILQVLPVADAPIAHPDLYSTREDTPIAVPAPGVLANDTDADGDDLIALPQNLPVNGTLIFPGDGSFIYTPDEGWNGTETFTYIATDGTLNSDLTTVTIVVGPVNDAPVANDDIYNVFEDTVTTVPAKGVLANDTDADDDVLTATLINGPLNGTVVLSEDGSFVYEPFANYYGPDSFTYQATDGLDNSNVATVTINVVPVQDQPIANADYFVVDENQQLIVADPGILGNDYDADGDTLTAILQAEPAHGQILLAAGGGFVYTPDENYNGSDEFAYFANDGTENSDLTTVTITVRPRNERPVANDDYYEVDEDDTLTINAPGVLANDTDSDDDALSATVETLPLHGTLVLNFDGSFTYKPANNYFGMDSFTYRVYDGTEQSGTGLVVIKVRPVNDAPVANPDNFFTQEETQLIVAAPGVLADDTDVDGDVLSAVLVDNVSSGVLVLNADGSFVYTPKENFSGVDTFTYKVSDGTTVSNTVTVTITVGVVNDVPVASADTYSLFEDTVFTVAAPGVLANDYDGDGDALVAQLVNGPLYGTLVLNGNGSFTYTPTPDFAGVDTFTYQATDGLSDSNIVTVTLNVVPRQDKPIANADFYSTTENKPLVVAKPGVLGNDADADGETLVALLVDNPSSGTVALAGDGSFVYTPEPGFHGVDTFTYVANDGHENSDKVTVTINVTPKNDAPVSVDDVYNMDEDTSLTVPANNGVLANDYDLDGDTLTAVLINQPLNGSVVLNPDGSFTYTPDANYNGTDYFIYRAYDGQDWSNPPSRVVINVRPVQDKPVGVNDMYSIPEDKVLVVQAPGILGNDSDVDGETLTAILVDAPQFGVITLQANGSFIYTPDFNFFGIDTFTYFANDGIENSDLVTVTISVGGRNDGPVAVDDLYYTNEDTALSIPAPGILGNDVDDDGDVLQAVLITPPLHGTVALQPSGAFVYTPNANYSGEDRFVYRASDGTTLSNPATVKIIVTEINDLPVLANVIVTPNLYEGQTAVLTADLSDEDPADTFLVTVNWGDGTAPTVQAYPAGTSKLFLTHLYADDNPTETPVDTNQVSITVQDNRGGADTVNRQVVVSNVPPTLDNVTLTQVIPTGGTARLTGEIHDVGVQDTFALGIWWGDGTSEVHNYGPGGFNTFDIIHTYAVPGFYNVVVGVMDDDLGTAIATPSILVRNTSDLVLTKTANPDPASVGELVTYTMIVTNNGPDLARNVILMDTIPANVDVISANPQFVEADGVLNWFLGDMPSGQTYRIDLVVKTRQQGPLHNVAKVISDELDPVDANNTASVTTTIGWLPDGPDLQAQEVTLASRCKMSKYGPNCTLDLWSLVANRGNKMANSFVYSAYLSVDNQLSADDIKLFTKRFPKLKPLQVKGQHQKFKAPIGFNSTNKFLIVVLDEGNLVFEGNETNNISVTGPLP